MVSVKKFISGVGALLCFIVFFNMVEIKGQVGLRAGIGASFINGGWEMDPYHKRGASDPLAFFSGGVNYAKSGAGRLNWVAGLHVSRQGYAFRIHNFFDQDLVHARRTMLATTLYGVSRLTLYESGNKQHTSIFGIQAGAYSSLLFAHRWKFADHPPRSMNDISGRYDAGILAGLFFQSTHKNGRVHTWDMKYYNGLVDVSQSPAYDFARLRYFETGYSISISKTKKKQKRK